jgi:hypothetical protein
MGASEAFPSGDDDQLRYLKDIINTLGAGMGGQSDLDRVMPDFAQGAPLSIIRGDYDGVPIPYVFQFVGAAGEWIERVQEEGVSAELKTEIAAGITIRESRHPGAPGWDNTRGLLAEKMQEAGDVEFALDLVYGMRSRHAMARAVIALSENQPDADIFSMISAIGERYSTDPRSVNLARRLRADMHFMQFMQATHDEILRRTPTSPALDTIEEMIRSRIPGYDPLKWWTTSMTEEHPEQDWDDLLVIASDDSLWTPELSMRHRQSTMMSYTEHVHKLGSASVDDAYIAELLAEVATAEAEVPDARIWDRLRYSYGFLLAELGHPAHSVDAGRAIRNPSLQRLLVNDLIAHNAEDDARRLANDITDTDNN